MNMVSLFGACLSFEFAETNHLPSQTPGGASEGGTLPLSYADLRPRGEGDPPPKLSLLAAQGGGSGLRTSRG